MARYNPDADLSPLYETMDRLRTDCLIGDGSLLSPGRSLWTAEHFADLQRTYVQNLDEGEGKFFEKLKVQLSDATAEAHCLMAELIWLLYAFQRGDVSPPTKDRKVREVWSWSGQDLPQDVAALTEQVLYGVGRAGQGYNNNKWRELVLLITAMQDLKSRPVDERRRLLGDGGAFASWFEIQVNGENRQLRHILPFLLFPDSFERISAGQHKRDILVMNRKKSSITVADVARAANVSKATAARVLGGYGVASESTRQSVIEAADRLGYQPNELARSMSTGRTGLIGVVVGDIENAFFSRAVRGISDTARAAGLNVVIANSGERPEQEREMVAVLLRQRVAGLIVAPTDDREVKHLTDAIKAGTPVVTLDRWVPDLGADGVCGGDHAAAILATEHLLTARHRRIAYVTAVNLKDGRLSDISDIPISAVRERVRGFMEAMSSAGIADPASLVRGAAFDDSSIDSIIGSLLTDEQRFTAILASDSLIGSDIFRSLSTRGIRLPRDMALISWFDADWTRVTSPPVSVIDQPTYLFGQTAVKRLIARMDGQADPPHRIVIPTPFIARGSTGACQTTD